MDQLSGGRGSICTMDGSGWGDTELFRQTVFWDERQDRSPWKDQGITFCVKHIVIERIWGTHIISVMNSYSWFYLHFSFSMKRCWITSALWRPSLQRGQIWQSPTLSSRRCSNYSADTTPLKIRPRLISYFFCPLLLFHLPLTYPIFPVTSITAFIECAQ